MDMRIINDITDFIFLEDIPARQGTENGDSAEGADFGEGLPSKTKADVIFIPGGSYAELPEKPTGRIKMYITAAALVGICAVCARLSIREEGKRK